MAKSKKQKTSARELAELGLAGVDTTKSKAPAYRRGRRKKETLELLTKYMGNVAATCAKVGISRATFYEWRQSDAAFDEAVRDINERTLDFVEGKLLEGIRAGNAKLIIFYLVNKGKTRGYSRRPEEVDAHEAEAAAAGSAELVRQHLEGLGVTAKGLPREELARQVAAKIAGAQQ